MHASGVGEATFFDRGQSTTMTSSLVGQDMGNHDSTAMALSCPCHECTMAVLPLHHPSLPVDPSSPPPTPVRKPRFSLPTINLDFIARNTPIPQALTLEATLSPDACPPLSARDFLNFLRAEQAHPALAFYIWLCAYNTRFYALPSAQQALSPEVTDEMMEKAVQEATERARAVNLRKQRQRRMGPPIRNWPKGEAPWERSMQIAIGEDGALSLKSPSSSSSMDSEAKSAQPVLDGDSMPVVPFRAPEATTEKEMQSEEDKAEKSRRISMLVNAGADEELQKTVHLLLMNEQPFKGEIAHIVHHFLTLSSPTVLTTTLIPPLLLLLRTTTHPSAFAALEAETLTYLRIDAHPRFICAAMKNVRPPLGRKLLIFGSGGYILAGVGAGLACVLVPGASRWWRLFSVLPFWLGLSSGLMLLSGVCLVLYGLGRRQLATWELLDEDLPSVPPAAERVPRSRLSFLHLSSSKKDPSTDPFVRPQTSRANQFFTTHRALREMQDRVFWVAAGWGLLGTLVWMALILSVPGR